MLIIEPKTFEDKSKNIDTILRFQRNRNEMFLEGINNPLTPELIDEAHNALTNIVGINNISKKAVEIILTLYPKVKIEILEFGIDDTSCLEILAGSVANFYLASRWYNNGDKVDKEKFYAVLEREIDLFEQKLKETSENEKTV